MKELPSLVNLEQSFQGKPFKVLLVNVKESQEIVKNFLKNKDLNLKIVFDKFGIVSAQYGVRSHPVKFLIDGQGKLMAKGLGYRDWNSEEMNKLVRILMGRVVTMDRHWKTSPTDSNLPGLTRGL